MNFDKLYQEAQANSVSFWDYKPTLTDEIKNSIGSVLSGAYTGLVAKPATLLGGIMVSMAEKLDDLTGMETDSIQTAFLKNNLAAIVKQTQLMQETAHNIGAVNATIYSISDVLSTFAGAGKLTKGVGGASATSGLIQGYADYENGLAGELDKVTSAQKGFISGAAVALGGYIPLTMGFRFSPAAKSIIESQGKLSKAINYGSLTLQDIAYTAGANIAIGAGYRGFTHEILKANGYAQMANQYKALDDTAMLIDAAFGLFFGGVAKYAELRQQNIVDALLAKNNQIHQTDSAVGIPTDIETLNAHNTALNKAFDDMINGRPVDVESILKNSRYLVKDNIDWNSKVLEAITKRFPDDAVFFSRNNTPIPGRVINEIREQLIAESKGLIKQTERRKLAQEIHDLNYKADKTDKDRLELLTRKRKSSSRKKASQERQAIMREAGRLHQLSKDLRKQAFEKQQYLKNHTRGGKHFDAKSDLSKLEQGIIPARFVDQIVEKTGMKNDSADFLKIADDSKSIVNDSEFKLMQDKAVYDDLTAPDILDRVLRDKPEMVIKFNDDNGLETTVKASELLESVNREVEQAKADKKIYDAAVACMLRNS